MGPDAEPTLGWVKDALVVPCSGQPWEQNRWTIDGGVYDAGGDLLESGRHLGDAATQAAPAKLVLGDVPVTPGRFLFGGWLQRHFGHLLATMGRLWALPEACGRIDGVVFLRLPDPFFHQPGSSPHAVPVVADLLACLGVGEGQHPLRVVGTPTRFEHLAMPEQILFGDPATGAAANAAYLAMLRRMRASPRVGDGLLLPGLYVSRSRLPDHYGRMLFEDVLEENLAAEGYAILYPERLTVFEQVAAYAAARRVIFAESSAIHLAIGQLDPLNPLAVIGRRHPMATSLQRHIQAAGLQRARLIDAVRGAVVALAGERVDSAATFGALSLTDMGQIREALVAAGLCRGEGWRLPTEAECQARVAAAIASRQAVMPRHRVRYVGAEALATFARVD